MIPPKVEADQSSSSYINNDNVNDELLSSQSIHYQKSKKQKISEGTPVSSSKFHRPSNVAPEDHNDIFGKLILHVNESS